MASTVFFSNEQYEIRPAKNAAEYKDMWWRFMRELGWNRGYYDLETYMDPSLASGMILLIDKVKAQPVGHVAAVVNANHTGWISMFIIEKEHRGKGLGAELFRAGLKDAENQGVKILGLDAVAEQKATYGRRGFVESPLGVVNVMTRNLVAKEPISESLSPPLRTGTHLIDIRRVPSELLVKDEVKHAGFARPNLWSQEHLFKRPDVLGFTLTRTDPPQNVEDILAWTVVRRCSGGGRIGPVYAHDVHSANVVLVQAMKAVTPKYIKDIPLPDEKISGLSEDEIAATGVVVIESWGGNREGQTMIDGLGFETQVAFHRMWVDSKAPPEQSDGGAASTGVFAIFDAAVG